MENNKVMYEFCNEYVNCLQDNIFYITKGIGGNTDALIYCYDCQKHNKEDMMKDGYECDYWEDSNDEEEKEYACGTAGGFEKKKSI
jgi:hypothetical protein